MGQLLARKYIVLVEGQVASEPCAHYDEAIDCAVSFAPEVLVEIVCYWSGRKVWVRRAVLRGFAARA